jgi:hypothetical protein
VVEAVAADGCDELACAKRFELGAEVAVVVVKAFDWAFEAPKREVGLEESAGVRVRVGVDD